MTIAACGKRRVHYRLLTRLQKVVTGYGKQVRSLPIVTQPRTIMEFSIREWRKMYDKIHGLGSMLRDSRPTYTDEGDYIAPRAALSHDAQKELEFQIKTWVERSNRYLNQCGMKMPKPLWYYDRKNPETWVSDPSFKYGHLLEKSA